MESGMKDYIHATERERIENLHLHVQDSNPEINKHTDHGDKISNAGADNKLEPVSHDLPPSIPDTRKKGASGLAGFMFWTNGISVFLLLVGFVTPGWLIYFKNGYQDFGLWYMTQCTGQDPLTTCQTLTYHTIEAIFLNKLYLQSCGGFDYGYDCELKFGGLKFSEQDAHSLLYFADTPLPFAYSDIVRSQALYTVGLIFAILTLKIWYKFRIRVRENRTTGFSRKKMVFILILSILSAFFVLFAVVGFSMLDSSIGSYTKSPVGRVFAGFGGGMMLLCIIVTFMHIFCCRDTYICSLDFRQKSPQKQANVV